MTRIDDLFAALDAAADDRLRLAVVRGAEERELAVSFGSSGPVAEAEDALAVEHPLTNGARPSEDEALDAYSRIVVGVAERLSPSVANLRVRRRTRRGGLAIGGGAPSSSLRTASSSPPPTSWRDVGRGRGRLRRRP